MLTKVFLMCCAFFGAIFLLSALIPQSVGVAVSLGSFGISWAILGGTVAALTVASGYKA